MAQGTVFGAQWWPKWEGIQKGRDSRIHVAGTCHCAQKLTQCCKKQPLLSSIYVMPDSLWPHKQGQKAHQAPLSFTVSQSLLRFMSIESVMPSEHLILSSPSPPALNLPSIKVFSKHQAFQASRSFPRSQVAKVLEFQLQHQSFQWIFSVDFL